MKWSTLILIVVALLAVVGVVIFAFPFDWAHDWQRDQACGDTSYEYANHANVEVWYDPSEPGTDRRIVYTPFDAQGHYWKFIDRSFVDPERPEEGQFMVHTYSATHLRQVVSNWHEKPWFPYDAWHWFDCTICATQGEC